MIPHIFLSKQIQTKWSNLISINFRSNLLHSNIDTPVNHYFQSQDNYSRIRVCLCWKVTSRAFKMISIFFVKISCNIFFLSFYFFQNIFFECISTLKLAINILDWKNLNYIFPFKFLVYIQQKHLSKIKKKLTETLVYIQQRHSSKFWRSKPRL